MRRLLCLFFMLFFAKAAFSQLEVKPGSFREVVGFVNINPDENYQYDDNDLPFAVIKIRTVNINDKQRRELKFGGNGGTFIMLEYKDGEVWVYLTAKYADYLKISHPDLSSIEFTLPYDLKPKCGYEMTLVNKTSNVSGSGSITVTTKPEDGATITLNGKVLNQKTPYVNDMIAAGQYDIIVSKERYKTVTETVNIADGDNKNLEITLPIDVATITITADEQTDVYVDGNLMNRGTWSGELYSGSHDIVCKKQYYYDAIQTITVEAETPASYNLNLNPINGKINIMSEPTGATVYIDNKEYGVTPLETDSLIIGPHELKIEKGIWRTLKKQIFLEDGKILTLNETLENCPDGVINALFSVSPTKKVYFSKGNLQYQASTKTWRFAEHQWDIIGSENSNISKSYSGWIDLFGWGTSGYKGKNPWTSNRKITKYCKDEKDIAGTNYDWGVYNTISNDGGKSWRTLTIDEWEYVLYKRNTDSGIRYAKATVNGVNGVILLPDNWRSSIYGLSNTNKYDESFSNNCISQSDWQNKFETNGAVFLPAAGWRMWTNVEYVGSYGYYWSASDNSFLGSAYDFWFGDRDLRLSGFGRQMGHSVRLVCDVE